MLVILVILAGNVLRPRASPQRLEPAPAPAASDSELLSVPMLRGLIAVTCIVVLVAIFSICGFVAFRFLWDNGFIGPRAEWREHCEQHAREICQEDKRAYPTASQLAECIDRLQHQCRQELRAH